MALTLDEISGGYFDVLRELGNIGAGNATTALATMIGSKIDMKVPQVMLVPFTDVGSMLGGEEQEMVGAYLGVDGDVDSVMQEVLKNCKKVEDDCEIFL